MAIISLPLFPVFYTLKYILLYILSFNVWIRLVIFGMSIAEILTFSDCSFFSMHGW